MTEFTGAELNRLIQLLPITDPTSEEYSMSLSLTEMSSFPRMASPFSLPSSQR